MQILVLSDIHANYPALEAMERQFRDYHFDYIVNCGDSLVYAPFPSETLAWLAGKKVLSILGNTDKKVIKLLKGETFVKPTNPEKRIMYTWTAGQLDDICSSYLQTFRKKEKITLPVIKEGPERHYRIGIYHGSPAKNHEFLFQTTPYHRFTELAALAKSDIVLCGHSHDPFYKCIEGTYFINPGSIGRMFDSNPSGSCATLQIRTDGVTVQHHRIAYDIDKTISGLRKARLPEIYCQMYKQGRKMN